MKASFPDIGLFKVSLRRWRGSYLKDEIERAWSNAVERSREDIVKKFDSLGFEMTPCGIPSSGADGDVAWIRIDGDRYSAVVGVHVRNCCFFEGLMRTVVGTAHGKGGG